MPFNIPSIKYLEASFFPTFVIAEEYMGVITYRDLVETSTN
jgi:hypothetical protein